MEDFSQDAVYEAVELSEAVFSEGRKVFDEFYDGEVDDYFMVQDIRNRVEEASMSSGEFVYPEDLASFQDFDFSDDTAARIFYGVEPGLTQGDLADFAGVSQGYASKILGVFEEEGLVESRKNGVEKQYFYGENAFPYLMVLSEAESVVDVQDRLEEADEEFEEVEQDESEVVEEPEESVEEDGKSLHDIMMDAADSEEDLKTTYEQRSDGGIETRDHTDTEEQDEGSNPSEDEYYEGW